MVAEYSRYMGDGDLLDNIMRINKLRFRSKQWPMRLFYHYLDVTTANAYMQKGC